MALSIQENEPLSRHTTLRVGGPARYWVEIMKESDLQEAAAWAREKGLPISILGGGSNVLASDDGFPGVILHMANRGVTISEKEGDCFQIVAEAGEEWDSLVTLSVNHDLAGWETMALIPGTLGGAVVGNIGAYGSEIKDTIQWVEALNLNDGRLARFDRTACQLRYRHSFFKTPEGRPWVVVRAAFTLRRHAPPKVVYPELKAHLSQSNPTLEDVRQAVIRLRQAKLPDWKTTGTAGSFFKNLLLPEDAFQRLRSRYPALPGYPDPNGQIKVPLGFILDKICGLRGWGRGKVHLHDRQALVLVNEGGTAADIAALATEIEQRVRSAIGYDIEWEVEWLGAKPPPRPSPPSSP